VTAVEARQGEGQKGRKRLGQQPSHVTSGSARYTLEPDCIVGTPDRPRQCRTCWISIADALKAFHKQILSPWLYDRRY
jgi:hypothetical protein